MRFPILQYRDGKKRVHWPLMLAFIVGTYAGVTALSEVFWFGFAGGFSPLVGLYALVAATLIVIRVVGGVLALPADLLKAEAGEV